jgi:glycerate kinase
MKILVAPDKFKGVLSGRQAAEHIAAGVRDVLADAQIDILPLADGGEGTAEIIQQALGGSWLKCKAHDPLGREIDARYGYVEDRKLAVMEMSETAGMRCLRPNERDQVARANTFGVGEMILAASRRGAKEIIVGLGGSATNDGGFGMARALAFSFYAGDKELHGFVTELQKLTSIARPQPSRLLDFSLLRVIAAADVKNPLLGENGATRIFGPQKGVTEDKIGLFETSLAKLADVVVKEFGLDFRNEPGAGAAGGLGFGLMSFCDARMRPGFAVVAEAVGLEAKVEGVDLVITGEGSLDRQTLEGKTPASVAKMARRLGKPVYAIAGRADGNEQLHAMFNGIYVVKRGEMSQQDAVTHAGELLRERARELGNDLNNE